ncbi:MAG: 50S ribosomal protein L1 [Planctomycetota bacterium]
MPVKSVRYRKQLEIRGSSGQPLPVSEAVAKIKEMAAVKSDRTYKNGKRRKDPDQTMHLVVHLGIDPKQADQLVRGSLSLPHGTGTTKKVVAFCDGPLMEKAKAAGAIEAGADDLIDKITKGWMDFDIAIAHPAMMGKIAKLGRILGPQGKMPSPKSGTVTADIETAVREYAAGKLEYRNDTGGNVHLPVGKVSFPSPALQENIEAIISHLQRVKPAAAKGMYLKRVCLAGVRTPSVTVSVG